MCKKLPIKYRYNLFYLYIYVFNQIIVVFECYKYDHTLNPLVLNPEKATEKMNVANKNHPVYRRHGIYIYIHWVSTSTPTRAHWTLRKRVIVVCIVVYTCVRTDVCFMRTTSRPRISRAEHDSVSRAFAVVFFSIRHRRASTPQRLDKDTRRRIWSQGFLTFFFDSYIYIYPYPFNKGTSRMDREPHPPRKKVLDTESRGNSVWIGLSRFEFIYRKEKNFNKKNVFGSFFKNRNPPRTRRPFKSYYLFDSPPRERDTRNASTFCGFRIWRISAN